MEGNAYDYLNIRVYDVMGREVSLFSDVMRGGFKWNAPDVAGIYMVAVFGEDREVLTLFLAVE